MSNNLSPAKKAWATRRANQQQHANSLRAKKAWVTRSLKQIKTNNEAFEKLSPAGKRVAIAKDVLAALAARQINATKGVWVNTEAINKLKVGTELQPILQQAECDCCALGACFVSAVKLGNNCKLTEGAIAEGGFSYGPPDSDFGQDSTGMWSTLKRYFTPSQLALIELAFENGDGLYRYHDVTKAQASKASDFYYQNEGDAEVRMVAIMKNIVQHNGTFKL